MMTRLQIALLIGLLVLVGSVGYAAGVVYSLNPVTSNEDVAACVKAGGKAALVADLAADGSLSTEWEPHCLVPSK